MKKRYLIIIFVLALLFTGCGTNSDDKVDTNISSEDKEEYYNTVFLYIKDVIAKINDAIEFKYDSTDVMLFIPAGNKITCVSDTVKGSPFSKEWDYMYVGVYYNGEEYLYSVSSRDKEGYGYELITEYNLFTHDFNQLGKVKEDYVKEFKDNYKEVIGGNKTYSVDDLSDSLKEFVKSNYKDVKTVVFIDPGECSY